MKDLKKINQDKCSALVKLVNHMDSIKNTNKINKSLLSEINTDNKIILRELDKLSRKLNKN
tara:strand:+ start:586 stop:768 length:183 start_codon:yes stop_codon:yes gene_type:complete